MMASKRHYLLVVRIGNLSLIKQSNVPALFVEPLGPMLLPGLASSVYALLGSFLESLSAPSNPNPWPLPTVIYPNPASSSSLEISSRTL